MFVEFAWPLPVLVVRVLRDVWQSAKARGGLLRRRIKTGNKIQLPHILIQKRGRGWSRRRRSGWVTRTEDTARDVDERISFRVVCCFVGFVSCAEDGGGMFLKT